jgi:hypothetical protein
MPSVAAGEQAHGTREAFIADALYLGAGHPLA